jgi:hypothetical protein
VLADREDVLRERGEEAEILDFVGQVRIFFVRRDGRPGVPKAMKERVFVLLGHFASKIMSRTNTA